MTDNNSDQLMHVIRRLGCGKSEAAKVVKALDGKATDYTDPQELANAYADTLVEKEAVKPPQTPIKNKRRDPPVETIEPTVEP